MSFAFPPNAPRLIVPVFVTGPRRSYEFRCALDTGSERTVLPAEPLRLLGFDLLQPSGRTRLHTASGIATAPLIRVPAITALERVRTNMLVAAHNLPLGVEADGLLGLDFFRGFILKLDFIRGRITLSTRQWWQFWQ